MVRMREREREGEQSGCDCDTRLSKSGGEDTAFIFVHPVPYTTSSMHMYTSRPSPLSTSYEPDSIIYFFLLLVEDFGSSAV